MIALRDLEIPVKVAGKVWFGPGPRGKTVPTDPRCGQCLAKELHSGCPLEVFGFNRGRGMCDIYLDSFTD